jgi:hypothetical protein
MKRILLSLSILLTFSQAKASDTLTVRQVFNFNVGDTFDYKIINFDILSSPFNTYPFFTVYQRYTIIAKDTSIYGSIKYMRQKLYPSIIQDTILISHLNNPIVYLQTQDSNNAYQKGISSNWDSIYNSVTISHLYPVPDCGCMHSELDSFIQYEKGLGITCSSYSTYYPNDATGTIDLILNTRDSLIYFSKGGMHYGTPYYNQPTGINYVNNISKIHIYPNPTSDLLHLSYSLITQPPPQFILTDILGQEVYSSSITPSETTHDISKLSKGIYTWRIAENNTILKTGKLIKE